MTPDEMEWQRHVDRHVRDRADAARSGLRIIASPIDDGGRMSVPMMALDGHRPHAGDGGDRSAGDVARDAWIEDTENRWRQGDVAPVIRSSERPVRGGGRSDPPRWGRPDEPPLDPDAQSERRKHVARSPEEVERIRDDAWERMRSGLENRWREKDHLP